MVQGYYTLQEASKFLSMAVDELKLMAQKGKIRSFQDRGTLRFRVQDIQELARVRGAGSDADVVLGEPTSPKSSGSSSARRKAHSPKTPAKLEAANVPDVFDFDMDTDDSVDLGADLPAPGSGAKRRPDSKPKKATVSPAPVGSDSDVRLVADGSDVTFSVPKEPPARPADSDVKISPDPLKPRTGVHPPSSTPKRASQLAIGSGAQPKPKSGATPPNQQASPRPGSGNQPADSGVRLVPMDSDSDVKLVSASDDVPLGFGSSTAPSDSNVRLDKIHLPPADSADANLMLTDEIDLDAELKRQEEKAKKEPSTKLKPKSELKLPEGSAFELSDSDVPMPAELKGGSGPKTPKQKKPTPSDSSDFDLAVQKNADGSSDFDLVPASDGSIVLEDSSGDFSLDVSDEHERVLDDDATTELTRSSSGISLNNPVDAGISLEEQTAPTDQDVDFDLSLEPEDTPKPAKNALLDDSGFELTGQKTPKPRKGSAAPEPSASSEFELTLDSDSDGEAVALQDSSETDSQFELNLESSDEGSVASSDSEFELTLDDSDSLQAAEGDDVKPQVKAKAGESAEQDIFETDFEVPALDDSDDAAVADSELESSDFDLALDDSELANEEESGSQVVALDEEVLEEETEGDAAVVDDVEVEAEGSEFSELDEDVEVEEEVEADAEVEPSGRERVVVKKELVPAAPWGVMPVIFMLPCVIIMFLVGILGYELVQSTANLKAPGPLTVAIADMFGQKFTK